ncbi:hypothetical protein WS85_02595 [Burkholderia anthina]|nr:hypothetical protein WS85_02595 [Burkholderia anthina]OXI22680.1 hypothetical protein CFB35_11975 [Burkholderia sp. AU16482]
MGRGRPEGTRLAMDGGCGRRTTRGESLTCLAFRSDFDGGLQAGRREKEGIEGRPAVRRRRRIVDNDAGAAGASARRAEPTPADSDFSVATPAAIMTIRKSDASVAGRRGGTARAPS